MFDDKSQVAPLKGYSKKKKVIYTSKMSKLFVYNNLSAGMVDSILAGVFA